MRAENEICLSTHLPDNRQLDPYDHRHYRRGTSIFLGLHRGLAKGYTSLNELKLVEYRENCIS